MKKKWNLPYLDKSLERKHGRPNTRKRSTEITKELVNTQQIMVYNGKTYQSVLLTEERIGYKLGEFVRTRTQKKKESSKTTEKKRRART